MGSEIREEIALVVRIFLGKVAIPLLGCYGTYSP